MVNIGIRLLCNEWIEIVVIMIVAVVVVIAIEMIMGL
jgi:hypothetical protein